MKKQDIKWSFNWNGTARFECCCKNDGFEYSVESVVNTSKGKDVDGTDRDGLMNDILSVGIFKTEMEKKGIEYI